MSHQTPTPAAPAALHKKLAHRIKSCLTPTRKGAETTTPSTSRPSSRSSTTSTSTSNLPITNTYPPSSSSTTTLVPSHPSSSTTTLSKPQPQPLHLHLQIPTVSHILPHTPTPTSPTPTPASPSNAADLAHPFLTTLLSTTHPTASQNGQITPLYAPSALRLSTLVALARTQDRASGIRLCGKLFRAVVIHEELAVVVWEGVCDLASAGAPVGGEGERGDAVEVFMEEMRGAGAGRCCVWCPVGGEGRGTCRGVVRVREEEWQEGVVWQKEVGGGKKWGDAPPVVG